MKGEVTKTLKGRVWSQWADNPDGELLFGIQYWNSGEPGSGTPNGRSSSDLDVKPPDPLFSCCAWGFAGGADGRTGDIWINPDSGEAKRLPTRYADYPLKAGDSFAFKSTLLHSFRNRGAARCVILWVNTTKPSEVRDGA